MEGEGGGGGEGKEGLMDGWREGWIEEERVRGRRVGGRREGGRGREEGPIYRVQLPPFCSLG